jgi:hypothetical protein
MARFWADELVGQALVIALSVVVGGEIVNDCPQRPVAEQDHPLQTGFVNGPH